MSKLIVGNIIVNKGEKRQGYLDILNTGIKLPITLINGCNDGKTVAITAGVHGGEYVGIQTAIELAKTIKPEEVSGKLIIVHPVNVSAFFSKVQYKCPLDNKNMNRAFPGKIDGTATEKIAYVITTEIFAQSDCYFDLHGGDLHEELTECIVYSCSGTDENTKEARYVASILGIRNILDVDLEGISICTASKKGAISVLIELGKCGMWSDELVSKYLKGIKNALKYYKVISGDVEMLCEKVEYLSSMDATNATVRGCWYPNIEPGNMVEIGEKTGEIRDFFGNVLCEYHAKKSGEVIYVVRSLAINADEPLYAIG